MCIQPYGADAVLRMTHQEPSEVVMNYVVAVQNRQDVSEFSTAIRYRTFEIMIGQVRTILLHADGQLLCIGRAPTGISSTRNEIH
jgi:hypothetical protein